MNAWQNKIVLVTGGSSGLGRVIAEAFAAEGAKWPSSAWNSRKSSRLPRRCRPAGRDVLGIHADITRQEDVDRLFAQTLDRFGRLDVLVNNAGRSMRGKVLDTTPEQFRDLMELNLIALVRCTRAAVPHLLQQRGHVVNIGSLAAKSAARWVGAYPATKFAVAAYSQQLRLELGAARAARVAGLPWPHPTQGRPLVSAGRTGRRAGAVPGRRGPACGCGRSRRKSWPGPILRACQRRRPELVVPGKARLLFALSQLWPELGDWIVRRKSG